MNKRNLKYFIFAIIVSLIVGIGYWHLIIATKQKSMSQNSTNVLKGKKWEDGIVRGGKIFQNTKCSPEMKKYNWCK